MPIACIDPGHNSIGGDTGAQAQGYYEQDFTLDICLRMKPLLAFNGITPVLTREGPTVKGPYQTLNQSLQTRYDISNNAQADIFVSVHINATPGGTGTEILIGGKGGKAQTLAEHLLPELIAASKWADRGIKVQTNVGVLGKRVKAPSVLTENGFIDSPNDILKLREESFRQALAVAHTKGICSYFGYQYKEQGGKSLMPKVAILKFTKEDNFSADPLSEKLGGVAVYCRKPGTLEIPEEAMGSGKLFVVGGATTNHPNEVLLSGNDKFKTAAIVGQWIDTH